MNMEQLTYLVDIAQSKSISQTAEKYHITHQGVSKSIKNLENELGVALMYRSPRGVVLTADGEYIVEKAHEVLKIHQEISAKYAAANHFSLPKLKGHLDLICIPRIIDAYLDLFLSKFKVFYPNVEISVHSEPPSKIFTHFAHKHQAQIGLLGIYKKHLYTEEFAQLLEKYQLTFTAFSSEEIFACGHRQITDTLGECYHSNITSPLPLIAYPYDLPVNNYTSQLDYEIASIDAQRKMIGAQLGLGMVTKREFEKFYAKQKKFALIPLKDPVIFHFGYVIDSQKPPSGEVKAFLDLINQLLPGSNQIHP